MCTIFPKMTRNGILGVDMLQSFIRGYAQPEKSDTGWTEIKVRQNPGAVGGGWGLRSMSWILVSWQTESDKWTGRKIPWRN